jgi:ABC-type antimicrobial peptide transport system permease subunit
MLKPLSYFRYYKSHKKKTLGIILSIAFSILIIGIIQAYTEDMIATSLSGGIQYEYLSNIGAYKDIINEDILNRIKNNEYVDKVIPVTYFGYAKINNIGLDNSFTGYFMDESDINFALERMGIKFTKGTIGTNDSDNIIVNEQLARARNITLGGYFGRKINSYDYVNGKYKVTGIMGGDSEIAFIPTSQKTIEENKNEAKQYVVFPKKGKLTEMNNFLESIYKGNFHLTDYSSVAKDNGNGIEDFNNIFNLLIIVNIVVLSVALGNSSYVHYFQRRSEFGMLKALGYERKYIILRMIKEICISSTIGFIIGFLLLCGFIKLNNVFMNYPMGLALMKIDYSLIPRIIAIPLFISVFSIIPISRLLVKVEPISIIERMS